METAIRPPNTLLPILYAVTALACAVESFRADPLAARAPRPLLGATLGLHALYLMVLSMAAARLWLPSFQWFA